MMQATDSTFSCAALLIFTITWGRWCICVLSWNEGPIRLPVTGCGKTRESRFLTAKAVRNDKEYRVERAPVNHALATSVPNQSFTAACQAMVIIRDTWGLRLSM